MSCHKQGFLFSHLGRLLPADQVVVFGRPVTLQNIAQLSRLIHSSSQSQLPFSQKGCHGQHHHHLSSPPPARRHGGGDACRRTRFVGRLAIWFFFHHVQDPKPMVGVPGPHRLPLRRAAAGPRQGQGLPLPLRLPPGVVVRVQRPLRRRPGGSHQGVPAQLRSRRHRRHGRVHGGPDDGSAVRRRGRHQRHLHHGQRRQRLVVAPPRPEPLHLLPGVTVVAALQEEAHVRHHADLPDVHRPGDAEPGVRARVRAVVRRHHAQLHGGRRRRRRHHHRLLRGGPRRRRGVRRAAGHAGARLLPDGRAVPPGRGGGVGGHRRRVARVLRRRRRPRVRGRARDRAPPRPRPLGGAQRHHVPDHHLAHQEGGPGRGRRRRHPEPVRRQPQLQGRRAAGHQQPGHGQRRRRKLPTLDRVGRRRSRGCWASGSFVVIGGVFFG